MIDVQYFNALVVIFFTFTALVFRQKALKQKKMESAL